VITDLKAKGVHGEVIDKAVDSVYDEVNEEKQALRLPAPQALAKAQEPERSGARLPSVDARRIRGEDDFCHPEKWDVDDETLQALEGERELE